MSIDYKSTVFLPRTELAMRANLPTREPDILARWAQLDLFGKLRAASRGREKFILHDGPPYANGHLHIGHALNKILKDVINRSQQMLGKDANYVPGWDCHGLPIEWKIEEQYRAAGKNKDEVPIIDFRRECREFANKWIDVQRTEFKRLGVIGDWANPYSTMAYAAEAQIAREIMKFAMSGQLYRGSKPVMWSVVERTALAEAEIEYHDHRSDTIWVRFPVVEASHALTAHASVVIWTTTPWTIPGNRAIAFGREIQYAVIDVKEVRPDSLAGPGEAFVVATDLVVRFAEAAGIARYEFVVKDLRGDDLRGTLCAHPLRGAEGANGYYDFDVPLLPGEFVTAEEGTGFVHIAPGHGTDDWQLGTAHRLEVPLTVGEDGCFYGHVPLFAGTAVYTPDGKDGDANAAIVARLAAAGALLARGRLTHSYPHSWRSKAPLIFRNTPQWFISMGDDAGADGLRAKALRAIDATRFYPESGRNRLRSMIEQRPDWIISRQRAWGVPIAVFVDKARGELLRDEAVNERIAAAFEREGADAWFAADPARFLGNDHDPAGLEQVTDIVDVWFESGATHSFVLETRPELAWPASLYLEGSDQHRGWFHSSLLESCGTRGRAPYAAVLTHGFVMAEDGQKMSKSLGNIVAPQEVVEKYGADILRLWVVGSDYSEDLRIGPEILKYQVDLYRRLRNTLRYLLGNLAGFDPAERVPPAEMPELERWVLHRLVELDGRVRRACDDFDFHSMFQALHNFCAVDLSAFYFDIRKDSLYCDPPAAPVRRACRTVLDVLYDCLTAWLAPVLCFTAEEVWLARDGDGRGRREESVHLRLFPEVPADWRDDALAEKWRRIRQMRRVVTGALEIERAEKRLGSSLQAHPTVHMAAEDAALLDGVPFADVVIASDVTVTPAPAPADAFALDEAPGVAVTVGRARGAKCARCWKVLPEVGAQAGHPELCGRCADAVARIAGAAAAG